MKRFAPHGFSVVELMAVIGMVAMLMVLLVPGLHSVTQGREVSAAAAEIAGILEQARAYAMAKNTYVWVGFAEEDGTLPPQVPMVPGGGRVVISVIASPNGERYVDDGVTLPDFDSAGGTVELVQIHRLVRLPGVRLTAANTGSDSGNQPVRPAVAPEYQVGDPVESAPDNESGAFAQSTGTLQFSYPLSGTEQYRFRKIIEFNPKGEASKAGEATLVGSGGTERLEVAVVPAPAGQAQNPYREAGCAAAAVQIDGLSGNVRSFH